MRRLLCALVFPALLIASAPLAFTGCERTVEEHTKTKTEANGEKSTEKTKVTENPNTGERTVTKEKKTDSAQD